MPYLISDGQSDCEGWATVKEESNGSYTTIGCHTTKQDAIDQMVAVSISEGIEPAGEVSTRAVDLSVPEFIRDNASRGLKYYEEGLGGDGLVDATVRAAREMAAGRITENKVRKMAPWFARHKVDGQAPKNSDPSHPEYPGAGLVAWLLWGGDSTFSDRAQNWAQRKIDALDKENRHAVHDQLSHGSGRMSSYSNLTNEQKEYKNTLSGEENEAIENYKGRNFISINEGLRSGQPLSEEDQKISNSLDKTISNAPSFTETKVFARGIDGEAKEKLFSQAKNGDIISDSGFLSTTADQSIAKSFTTGNGATLIIQAPAGSKALALDLPSSIQSESEVLFGRNTKLKILEIDLTKSQIKVEVML
jgi:hypothetical protein